MTEAMGDLERTLGPVFRLTLLGETMVVTTRPEDAKTMFANEGVHPVRVDFPALRLVRQRPFGSGGVVTELENSLFNIFCYLILKLLTGTNNSHILSLF